MSQLELLHIVINRLIALGINHMLVGSYASSYHGESRSTHDIDIVVDLPPEKIAAFIDSFDLARYYLSEIAFREGRMANIIDTLSGDKVDLFFLRSDEASQREFSRRQSGSVLGVEIDIATAEDVILSKLRWDQQLGGSQQQRNDVFNILRIRGGDLNIDYLKRHAGQALETLQALLRKVGEMQE